MISLALFNKNTNFNKIFVKQCKISAIKMLKNKNGITENSAIPRLICFSLVELFSNNGAANFFESSDDLVSFFFGSAFFDNALSFNESFSFAKT